MRNKSRSLFVLVLVLFNSYVFALDNLSFSFAFGTCGKETVNSQSSSIQNSTVSMPYTKWFFYPDIYVGINFPMAEINENIYFGSSLSYDVFFDTYESDTYTASDVNHRISLLPQLVFMKDNFRFYAGCGITFNFEVDEGDFTSSTSGGKLSEKEKTFQVEWCSSFGIKYILSKHFSVFSDIGFSVPFAGAVTEKEQSITVSGKTTNDDTGTYKYSGGTSVRILPKVGISFML